MLTLDSELCVNLTTPSTILVRENIYAATTKSQMTQLISKSVLHDYRSDTLQLLNQLVPYLSLRLGAFSASNEIRHLVIPKVLLAFYRLCSSILANCDVRGDLAIIQVLSMCLGSSVGCVDQTAAAFLRLPHERFSCKPERNTAMLAVAFRFRHGAWVHEGHDNVAGFRRLGDVSSEFAAGEKQ
jgi:hypothetical protein